MAYDYSGVGAYGYGVVSASSSAAANYSDDDDYQSGLSLKEWARDKPLSILQLDPADRAVLRIAGKSRHHRPPPSFSRLMALFNFRSCLAR